MLVIEYKRNGSTRAPWLATDYGLCDGDLQTLWGIEMWPEYGLIKTINQNGTHRTSLWIIQIYIDLLQFSTTMDKRPYCTYSFVSNLFIAYDCC